MERIKFFSIHDWSSGGMLKKIEELVMNGTSYKVLEINDALEIIISSILPLSVLIPMAALI